MIASIHLDEEGDWTRTKAAVLERNALQTRSASTGTRLESELRQRLQRPGGQNHEQRQRPRHKRLQEVLTRPEFLEMRGVAKEVPIFIQTYGPADEAQLRVKHVDLFELVLQLLEAKGYLDVVLQEEASWSRSDLFDTLQNVAEPTAALVPKLITGSGVPLPAHPHDS